MSIGIRSGRIWGISKQRLIKALGEHYTKYDAIIYFDTMGKNSNIMTDKVVMNQKLDKLKILHPKTYYHPFDNMPLSSENAVIKYRFGSRGTHLTFTTFDKINKAELYDMYVQDYIPFEKEYRVGIYNNKVLGIREKLLRDCSKCGKIKNSKSCYYETRDIPKLSRLALKVAKKFDVNFTGIDIGEWNGKFIVIELNSSPTIGEYWADLIAKELIDKCQS